MKYLSYGGFQRDSLMKLTLGLSLLMLAGFWFTSCALYFMNMDFTPASVVNYYNGNEAEFHPPRSARSMLEVTHMHLPMFALVLLLLTHLLIFAPMKRGAKVAFILVAFGSALLFEASGWMTRFWHPGFGALKVGSFLRARSPTSSSGSGSTSCGIRKRRLNRARSAAARRSRCRRNARSPRANAELQPRQRRPSTAITAVLRDLESCPSKKPRLETSASRQRQS